jgi:MOSC domain-containing protein YiiM
VVDLPSAALNDLLGHRLRIGTVELDVTVLAGDCPGVYAQVPVPGDVSVGDELLVGFQPE